ncbi:MAG TPA: nucleotide disphospho-sugar-binding domain-containing protein [Opitutales bacterium]|nr:nucleotide disphospho-sugar-binding domain-containing protein [Opitutales bacterium]
MSRPLSLLFAPFGSEGDVRPVLWLAGGLAARGHRITFIITPYYRRLVESRGWAALDIGTVEEFSRGLRDPRLWQPRAGSELVIELMIASLPRYAAVLDHTAGNFDLVVGTTLGTGAFTWAEQRRLPRLLLHLQPMCLRSAGDCPVFLEGLDWLRRAPDWVKRGLFGLSDFLLARKLLASVNAYRATRGLRPLREIYPELWNGADGVAALFPDWYGPAQPDWPRPVRQFGFPREPAQDNPPPLPAELENFLTAGEPPILWTHGSANLDTEKFAAVARAATSALGARGLLVGPAFTDAKSDGNFLAIAHAPFERVFSRCRAVVHHGGIGTSVQALAAGVPQLVVPRAHDQPDNAARLARLGVGARLRYGNFSAAAAMEKLRGLLADPATAAACAQFQQKIHEARPLPALCDWAETLAG